MSEKDFNKYQRNNILWAIVGFAICVSGIYNVGYNKGTIKGASVLADMVKNVDKNVYDKILNN